MAETEIGAHLTALYVVQQGILAAQASKVVLELLPALDIMSFATIDRTWPPLERVLASVVAETYASTSGLALNYYEQFRAVEGVIGAAPQILAAPLPAAKVATSLKVTGPYIAKALVAKKDPDVVAKTMVSLIGSTTRLGLEGGRETLRVAGNADPKLLGWSRVCGGRRPCAWCRMLRSRGPVYKSQKSATFSRRGTRYHDHCRCHAEGVYTMDSDWAPGARDDLELWDQSTEGLSGKEALSAFRRAIGTGH